MVHQAPVPQAKYALLADIRKPRWKVQALCLSATFLAIGVLFLTRACVGILSFGSSDTGILPEVRVNNAAIVAWVRRARMYAESTKKNQNAERNYSATDKADQSHQILSRKSVVCYYTIPGDLNSTKELSPSNVDPHLCTHLIVGFASVVKCTLSLGENSWVYKKIADLKNKEPNIKVMISVGGINELHSGFPEMVKNHSNRKKFIRSVLNTTKLFNLDGLDVDWEFPAWLDTDGRQKIHFVQLLQELRKEFDRSGQKLLLTVAVAAPQAIIDQSYNVPQMAEHVDFINLMAYDYHYYIWYLPITGLNAPLFPRSKEIGYLSTLNVHFSANYWISKGMPREKIVVGIPTYGHSYKLDNLANHDLEAPVIGFGDLGAAGFVSYPTVCWFLRNGATRIFENESKVPFAYKDHEWISYDDVASVTYKTKWIQSNGFKGAMVLSLNEDDWNSTCNENVTFPLTRTIRNILQDGQARDLLEGL